MPPLSLKEKYMKSVILNIEGMKCGMCEAHICDHIRKVFPNAKKVKADHKKGIASFIVDEENVDVSLLIKAISSLGYQVHGHKIEPYQKKGLFSFLKK